VAAKVTIYHNPKCSTSRQVLETIRARGAEPEIVPYLQNGWSAAVLKRLMKGAGASPRDFLRAKEPLAKELGLTGPDATPAAIVAAMLAHPILVERPIVETPKGVRLCRPVEKVLEIL